MCCISRGDIGSGMTMGTIKNERYIKLVGLADKVRGSSPS